MSDLPLLQDPDGVAEGVADAHVGAVEVIGWLLGEVGDAALLQGLVQAPGVVGQENEAAQGALGDQLAKPGSRGIVVQRGARQLEEDLRARSPGKSTVSHR